MSMFRPFVKIFQEFSKFQQLSPISTTSHLYADCGKRPKGKQKCNLVKSTGCAPRARKDCEPKHKPRIVCQRLQVPDPSYTECLKDPRPKHRKTECTVPKMPPLHCIKPNPGISIDGCQPRDAPPLGTCKLRISKRKSEKKKCDPKDICDPDLKPFKKAGPVNNSEISCPSESDDAGMSSSSTSPKVSCPSEAGPGMSCPSEPAAGMCCPSSSMISKKCEPAPSSSPFSTPVRNYSTKCKRNEKPKKPCFKPKKMKAKKGKGGEMSSPVSCTVKGVKGNKCEQAKCGPSFEVCDKPRPINQHKCPLRVKKPRMMSAQAVTKKRKIKMGYKTCKEPKKQAQFSCKPKPTKKAIVKPPPTPTRCPCFKPVDLKPPSNVPVCEKMPGAVKPDCNKKGGKQKAVCSKDECSNK